MAEVVALHVARDGRVVVADSGEGFHLGRVPELPVGNVVGDPDASARRLLAELGLEAEALVPRHAFDLRGDVMRRKLHVYDAVNARGAPPVAPHREDARAALDDRFASGGKVGPALAAVLAERRPSDTAHVVAPHVEMVPLRVPTLPPATHTNAFLVGRGRAIVVEPATDDPEEMGRLVRHVRERQAEGTVFEAIVLTHHHPDHVGGANALAHALQLPIYAHEATGQRLAGHVRLARTLKDGDELSLGDTSLAILHTPGHAPGHVVLRERRSGAMIVGDMVAGVGTILVEPIDGDMTLYLESLERMRRAGASMLLPAHGGVVADPDTWLAHYVAHRLAREAKIVDALGRIGLGDVDAIVPVAYADTPPMAWPLARLSTEAHLQKLEREGRVERLSDGQRRLAGAA